MPIQLDDFEISDRQLISLIFDSDKHIHFRGRALDDEGASICHRLSRFKTGEIVEVRAESSSIIREGVYKIYDIEIPPREEVEKELVIYRFSGKLAPVY